jgi:hypothetical protein
VVAVEGSRTPELPYDRARTVEDATAMKAPTVIQPGASRPADAAPEQRIDDRAPEPGTRLSGVLWAVVGVAAAAVLAGVLWFASDRAPDPGANPDPSTVTPSPPVVEALGTPPVVEARRTAAGVRFEWSSPDARDGDEWLLEGENGFVRTQRSRTVVRSDEPVCLTVQLVRGAQSSPPTRACVG